MCNNCKNIATRKDGALHCMELQHSPESHAAEAVKHSALGRWGGSWRIKGCTSTFAAGPHPPVE